MLGNSKVDIVGGIHPYDGKDLSKDKPIQDVLPKGEMVYPLSQHIGAPAKPIVAKGDRVLAGQKDSGKWWLRVGTHLCICVGYGKNH